MEMFTEKSTFYAVAADFAVTMNALDNNDDYKHYLISMYIQSRYDFKYLLSYAFMRSSGCETLIWNTIVIRTGQNIIIWSHSMYRPDK